jgi:hypothetical protein
MGIFGIHPAVFVRVASKGLTGYGTWKSAQRIENKGFANTNSVRESEMRKKNGEQEMRGAPTPRAFVRMSKERGCGRWHL